MLAKKSNSAIAATLTLAVLLWGGSNVGTKFTVASWPPICLGASRIFLAGMLLLAVLRWTSWLGKLSPLSPSVNRQLWLRGGLTLGVYILIFNFAMKLVPASHVALYLGMSPIWALVWEERPVLSWHSMRRYLAAVLAVSGVVVLSWPSLQAGGAQFYGELLASITGPLWTFYSRQCRTLGSSLSGAEVSAHTMWRAGLIMMPFAVVEFTLRHDLVWRWDLAWAQIYCIIGGGVMPYALWNNGLRYWPTSKVFLFNNLVPIATMTWSYLFLHEPVTRTFWFAMMMILIGLLVGQGSWPKILGYRWVPEE